MAMVSSSYLEANNKTVKRQRLVHDWQCYRVLCDALMVFINVRLLRFTLIFLG